MILYDNDLKDVFKNKIIQNDNLNANSDLFIYNDLVLKVYDDDKYKRKYYLSKVKEILKKDKHLSKIKELVLPLDLLIYNGKEVGFIMPYIKGFSLQEIIDQNILTDQEMYIIFIKLINVVKQFDNLPFDFALGDLHEKNIIVNDNLNINIIDSDGFIINNKKLKVDGNYILGKYINFHYQNKEIKKIGKQADYYCILCMILVYLFGDIIEDNLDPVSYLKKDEQFKGLESILNRTDDFSNFYLKPEDVDMLFNFKNKLNYIKKDDPKLKELIKKVRKWSD